MIDLMFTRTLRLLTEGCEGTPSSRYPQLSFGTLEEALVQSQLDCRPTHARAGEGDDADDDDAIWRWENEGGALSHP